MDELIKAIKAKGYEVTESDVKAWLDASSFSLEDVTDGAAPYLADEYCKSQKSGAIAPVKNGGLSRKKKRSELAKPQPKRPETVDIPVVSFGAPSRVTSTPANYPAIARREELTMQLVDGLRRNEENAQLSFRIAQALEDDELTKMLAAHAHYIVRAFKDDEEDPITRPEQVIEGDMDDRYELWQRYCEYVEASDAALAGQAEKILEELGYRRTA